jgi:hypothetical protein
MAEPIHRNSTLVRGPADLSYSPRVMGEERADGTWAGWIEFASEVPGAAILATERETTQPSRAALLYWATGLEPIYFEGAFERALLRGQRRARRISRPA